VRAPALVAACLALAALSLLLPWALAFDPYAWLVWGREIAHGTLDTSAGPSWKPGPVLLTTPLSLLGDLAAPGWLVLARTGAGLAVAGAAALAWRLGAGRLGAACAALVLALSPWWWFNAALGNSEGCLAAAVLWAAVAHLAGRPRLALLALLAGSLLRPEVWPFLGLYGIWTARAEPGARPAVAASLAAVALLWFVPGALGGGGAAEAAQGTPSTGSAALADVPFLAVLQDAVELLTVPAAVALVLLALRRPPRVALLFGAAAAAYVLIVAVMTQAGYAGNPRYLVPAAALAVPLAATGAGRLAPLLAVAVAAVTLGDLADQTRDVGVRAETREGLAALPAPACAVVRTSVPQRSAVAWELHRPLPGLERPPRAPASVLRARPYAGGPPEPRVGAPFAVTATAPRWALAEACPALTRARAPAR
jgi:hypothetical protein